MSISLFLRKLKSSWAEGRKEKGEGGREDTNNNNTSSMRVESVLRRVFMAIAFLETPGQDS